MQLKDDIGGIPQAGITFTGPVHIDRMFDIHDNEYVEIHNHYENVHSARNVRNYLTPTQEKAKDALITLTSEGQWEKQQWWAVWKVLMALHLVNKSAREFANYLIDLGVTADNVYDSIRRLDASFSNIAKISATEWQQYNGKYGDKYQKQIDTASRLLALLSE